MAEAKRHYRADIYVRLSKEDGDVADAKKAESNSISNQKALILNFLKDRDDIELAAVYEDDGYTGSNFDRPGFRKMMDDIEAGRADCVVVKDISRFGREYIMTGNYIQRVFPALGVRFIAINDGVDTAGMADPAGEIALPFRNLMNDAFCADTSVKIRSQLDAKRKEGQFVGNFCPYGYRKAEGSRGRLEPDGYAAGTVRDIFRRIKEGESCDAISRTLNEAGVPSPMEHKRGLGLNYSCNFKKKARAEWTPTAVRRIAANPVYTGTLVQGAVTTPNHKVKKRIARDASERITVEDAHEAIVGRRDYETVQRLLATDMRTAPGRKTVYLMSGLCTCADCGAPMTRKTSKCGGKTYAYYMCSDNRKYGACSPHRIREDRLEEEVTGTVGQTVSLAADADRIAEAVRRNADGGERARRTEELIKANEEETERCGRMLASLYEDFRDGTVDGKDFAVIRRNLAERRAAAEKAAAGLRKAGQTDGEGRKRLESQLDEFRLLLEDAGAERGTIAAQTALVEDFISRQDDLELYGTYTDDAVSGTIFTRPGFDRIMADMRGGKIQAIAVKDMSRLGRDYIETGNLVEHVFPLYGVRLISITDGFDTAKDPAGLMMAVTNLTNAMYAQDISRKINSAKAGMIEKGIPIGKIPFGYRMDRSDPEHPAMAVDEEAAETVRRIFRDFLSGKGTTAIARTLNGEGVPPPLAYRYMKNGQTEKAAGYRWTANSVQQILCNEAYTGKYAMAKTEQRIYRPEKRRLLPEGEWRVFEHHHPAIIPAEDFERMKARKQKKSARGKNPPNLLRGKVFCGCCGAHMGIPDSAARTPKYACRTNLYYGGGCGMGSIEKSAVYDAVFRTVKDTVRFFLDEQAATSSCKKSGRGRSAERERFQRELAEKEDGLRRIETKKTALYGDFCGGLLSEEEYLLLNGKYTEEMEALSAAASETRKQMDMEKKAEEAAVSVSERIKRFKSRRKLSQEMADALVERVDIHGGGRIAVTLKFEDEMRLLKGRAEGREAGHDAA